MQTVPLNSQVVQLINHIWPPLFEMYESEDNKYVVFAAAIEHYVDQRALQESGVWSVRRLGGDNQEDRPRLPRRA